MINRYHQTECEKSYYGACDQARASLRDSCAGSVLDEADEVG